MAQLARRLADLFHLAEHPVALDLLRILDHPVTVTRPRRLLRPDSHWHEHIPFAMYLVDILRPRLLVELGAHHGISYCAFCQAVGQLGLPTRACAVDSWAGDPHTGEYGEDILADLRAHHDPLYGGWSTLLQSTFDDALGRFPDGTIDLLHIDGYHTYEAVQHDFENWLPKVSARGVVLLHDTNVREKEFGVYRFFEELRTRYRTFEFLHGNGLGIVALGEVPAPELRAMLDAGPAEITQIREVFAALGRTLAAEYDGETRLKMLTERLAICEKHIRELEEGRTEYEKVIVALEGYQEEYKRAIESMQGLIAQLSAANQELQTMLDERTETVRKVSEQLEESRQALAARPGGD